MTTLQTQVTKAVPSLPPYRYNAEEKLNFKNTQTVENAIDQLHGLLREVVYATGYGLIDAEKSVDAQAGIKKAIIQACKPFPHDGNAILRHLHSVSGVFNPALITKSPLTPLANGYYAAINMCSRVFERLEG